MNLEERKLLKRIERARESGKLDDWEVNCRRLAELYSSCGFYEKALDAYKEELLVCETKADAKEVANAHRMVGEMYNALGQFAESLDHVNRYLDYARKSRNNVEEQRALATIGRTYFCWASELKASDSLQEISKANLMLKECRKAYMKSLYICEQELKNISNHERQEMKARILFNLGLACEIDDDVMRALDYVNKSIVICKQENLLEDLHRCYISQGTMLLKQNDTALALSSIERACELAKKLPNSTEGLVLALLHKSEIYFAMGNYMGARTVLKKAFKLNSSNNDDKENVEISLKRAILLCDLETKLTKTNENDTSERKVLFEKLGDACCSVKNFKHAIQCYNNMLECAVQLGQSGKELQPCYVSLYQTYRDDKNYNLALEYARKEFEFSKHVPLEAAKSHLFIGEILELTKSDYYEIIKEYEAAKEIAKRISDENLLGCALRKLITVQRNDGRDDLAKCTEQELTDLGLEDLEESQSDGEASATAGVHLSDLSDSDEETCRSRSARNTFKVTRNEKGETPLHVASIKGDLARVQRLISLGHSVKERDLAGWTPLHEAANHGHVEIVECLVKAGAEVNDPGGKDCGGVTPLHDAASCGHFNVIDVLLQNDASVTVLTDTGETPLECLKAWRKRVDDLSDEDERTYERIQQEFQTKLKAAGFSSEIVRKLENTGEIRNSRRLLSKERRTFRNRKESNEVGGLLSSQRRDSELSEIRRSVWGTIGPDHETSENDMRSENVDYRETTDNNIRTSGKSQRRDGCDTKERRRDVWSLVSPERCSATPSPALVDISDSSPTSRAPSSKKTVADYRAAMDALRKRPLSIDHSKPAPDRPALVDENSYIDEWLEDDLRQHQKQKKRKISDYLEGSNVRRSSEDNWRDSTEELAEIFYPLDDPVDFPSSGKQAKKKPKQTTLTSAGFHRIPSPTPNDELETPPQSTVLDGGADASPPISSVSQHATTKVRVNVGKHLLLIPVDNTKVSDLTVKWLAEEAGRRYFELEGAEPKLQLKTRDGAMISSADPISFIFDEDLDCNILGWKNASLSERYLEAVGKDLITPGSAYGAYLKGRPDREIMRRLAACDTSKWLNLQYMALTESELAPVMRVLRHERNLQVLNLAGNVLEDSGLESLMHSLENCSVQELNIKCNNITSNGFSKFVDGLASMGREFVTSLRVLDVSFNPIGEISLNTSVIISSMFPNLSQFKTDHCDLPSYKKKIQ